MKNITDSYNTLKEEIPQTVKLVAVTKTRTTDEIMELYRAGHRIFGENRVQELLSKKDKLPADIEWHIIGHLQTNKIRSVAPFIGMIESVDSYRLLKTINDEAAKAGRIIRCLLQIHIADEESKFGFTMQELGDMLRDNRPGDFKNVAICGVMGMATFTDNIEKVASEFAFLKKSFSIIKERYMNNDEVFSEISMGMSGDFKTAIEQGSTMVRIGSLIFGERNR
ncbi:MAG: YggS family pyridoxal phosphate-dependent enzyme [Bacteroidales bacterium]|jgi:pyridoxal phosphate enzyme (YggS family)|nr:YggS family pyridoxal phosphate-dependent enzyme [Bacteroidales bacterium]